jgi:hypothetical protein
VQEFKVGDKAQYNKKYRPDEVVTILEIEERLCLVLFPSGTKLVTKIGSLVKI